MMAKLQSFQAWGFSRKNRTHRNRNCQNMRWTECHFKYDACQSSRVFLCGTALFFKQDKNVSEKLFWSGASCRRIEGFFYSRDGRHFSLCASPFWGVPQGSMFGSPFFCMRNLGKIMHSRGIYADDIFQSQPPQKIFPAKILIFKHEYDWSS